MPWLLVDVLLGFLALAGLAVVLLNLWRRIRTLGRELGRASDAIARATDELASAQTALPNRPGTDSGPAGAPPRR